MDVPRVSAKTGVGVDDSAASDCRTHSAPEGDRDALCRRLIIDSWFTTIILGCVTGACRAASPKKDDKIHIKSTKGTLIVTSIGCANQLRPIS